MDSYRAARDLNAVDDRVVSLRSKAREQFGLAALDRALEGREVFVHGRSERVVHRIVAPVLFVKLEHRELRHPERRERVRLYQLLAARDLVAKRSERSRDDGLAARDYQNGVALLCARRGSETRDSLLAQSLQKRRRKLVAQLH